MRETCPDCSSDRLFRTSENNEIMYSCESCDWYKVEKEPFLIGTWSVKIHQALAPLDILQSLFTASDVTDFLRSRLKGISYLGNPDPALKFTVGSDEYLRGEIDIAYQVYLRQMIVLASTYIEVILKDFFRSFFVAKPSRMNQVLSPSGKGEAMISLNEILNTDSIEQLVINLVEKSAIIKGSNEPDKVLISLLNECKINLDKPLIDDIKRLKEQRNRIVHEEMNEEIGIKLVLNNFGMILYLLYVLAKVAEHYDVPYLDDVDFLIHFEERMDKNRNLIPSMY